MLVVQAPAAWPPQSAALRLYAQQLLHTCAHATRAAWFAGDGSALRPLGDLIATSKAQLVEDMGAIGVAAAQLPPLLARAAVVRPCEQRLRGSGESPTAEDAAAAEARVRRLMGAAGAGLEQLRALNATLAQ